MAPVVKENAEDATVTLVKLQSQQFAFQYAVSLRPKSPFDGVSKEIEGNRFLPSRAEKGFIEIEDDANAENDAGYESHGAESESRDAG